MSSLVLIGGGGHCRSVLDSALRMKAFDRIVITDPDIPAGEKILGCEVVGGDECLNELKKQGFDMAFVTVGSVKINPLREELVKKASSLGYGFPVITDPSAVVSDHAVIGNGSFIGKGAIVNAGSEIGNHCIINTGAIAEHDCKIGDFTHVSVGTVLCGGVTVGSRSMIGSGSTVIQGVKIGDRCIVGAGAMVNREVVSESTVVGIPAVRK